MHAVFFGLKRAHLRVVAISREMLDGVVLTPARFDMMRIVWLHAEHGILQAKIRDLLGVSAATVSVMLRSLERLGFVRRGRFARDQRCVLVRITEVGIQQVELALARLIESGVADRVVGCGCGLSAGTEASAADIECFRGLLTRVRRNYADQSPFEHPWTLRLIAGCRGERGGGRWGATWAAAIGDALF